MRGNEARCALLPRARGLQSWGPATPGPPELTLESPAVLKSQGLPEASRRQKCLLEGKGQCGQTAADQSCSQGCVFPRHEEDTQEAGRTRGREICLCLPEPCPRLSNFRARGLGSGGAGWGSKLIGGAVCEGRCLLDALILLGAGVSLEATQLLPLFVAAAATGCFGPAALLLGLLPS